MLEIKNIVNRKIDGIPKKEYWIQTQLQMETCDLDECDFLETFFLEYENEDAWREDRTTNGKNTGVILYFSKKDGSPFYVYKPWKMDTIEEIEKWQEQTIDLYSEDMIWVKNIYWKLQEFSCVLIQRNKLWFKNNVNYLADIWKTIEKERNTGFQHRLPTSSSQTTDKKEQRAKTAAHVFMNIEESPLFKHFSVLKTN
jgi:hypothetical protein